MSQDALLFFIVIISMIFSHFILL